MNRRLFRAVQRPCAGVFIALGGLLAACASTPPPASPLPRTESTVLLSVPAVHQDRPDECGVATLNSLCNYHGLELPADEIERLSAIAKREQGLSGGELREALRGVGLPTFLVHGSLDHGQTGLYQQIDLGRPPIVMIARSGDQAHFCLFTGYDLGARTVYVYDPRRGHLCLPASEFEPLWERAQRFTLISLPPPPPLETS